MTTAIAMAGCAASTEPTAANPTSTTPASIPASALEGKWHITQVGSQAVHNQAAQLQFDMAQQRLSASVGCNHLFGPISVQAGTISTSAIASTRMACPTDLAKQESALAQQLAAVQNSRFTVQQQLTITDSQGQIQIQAKR